MPKQDEKIVAKPTSLESADVAKDDFALLAQPLLAHIHLNTIHLIGVSAVRHPAFDGKGGVALNLSSSESMQAKFHEENKTCSAVFDLGVKAMRGEEPVIEIKAMYRVIYTVDNDYAGDRIGDRAVAFCHANSLSHVWSYWRELLSSMSVRMEIPLILAPLLIVGARLPKKDS